MACILPETNLMYACKISLSMQPYTIIIFCLNLYSLANILPYELHVHLYVSIKHDIDMRLTYDMLTCKASFTFAMV